MSMSQIDLIRRQTEASARNQVSGARARLRRGTSLVGQVSQWSMELSRQGEALVRQRTRRPQEEGGPGLQPGAQPSARPAEDGYQRRSPVQPVMVPRDYRQRRLRRALRIAALAALVLVGVAFLMQSGLLAF